MCARLPVWPNTIIYRSVLCICPIDYVPQSCLLQPLERGDFIDLPGKRGLLHIYREDSLSSRSFDSSVLPVNTEPAIFPRIHKKIEKGIKNRSSSLLNERKLMLTNYFILLLCVFTKRDIDVEE